MNDLAAFVDGNGVVTDVFYLRNLNERPGAVRCPEHIGIGMNINDPVPPPSEEERIASIKRAAGMKIVSRYPEWKQRNLNARASEILEILATGGALTAAEEAERAAIKAAFVWIKSIRNASDAAEANGDTIEQFEATLAGM